MVLNIISIISPIISLALFLLILRVFWCLNDTIQDYYIGLQRTFTNTLNGIQKSYADMEGGYVKFISEFGVLQDKLNNFVLLMSRIESFNSTISDELLRIDLLLDSMQLKMEKIVGSFELSNSLQQYRLDIINLQKQLYTKSLIIGRMQKQKFGVRND